MSEPFIPWRIREIPWRGPGSTLSDLYKAHLMFSFITDPIRAVLPCTESMTDIFIRWLRWNGELETAKRTLIRAIRRKHQRGRARKQWRRLVRRNMHHLPSTWAQFDRWATVK